MPLVLRDARRTREFLAHLSRSMPDPADVHQVTQELENIQAAPYANAQECFDDRGAHRVLWYQAISHYNQPNAAALGMAIFDEHDLYCGLRSSREFHALKNAGVFDVAVWVDASHRVEPEARASCTVEPWMADYVIDNNGTFDELLVNVRVLMERILEDY